MFECAHSKAPAVLKGTCFAALQMSADACASTAVPNTSAHKRAWKLDMMPAANAYAYTPDPVSSAEACTSFQPLLQARKLAHPIQSNLCCTCGQDGARSEERRTRRRARHVEQEEARKRGQCGRWHHHQVAVVGNNEVLQGQCGGPCGGYYAGK